MTTKKISDEEISSLAISSLPTRPTAPKAFGGRGYTAAQMKEAFDKLPLLLADRFNRLIDDICADAEVSICASMSTGLAEGHTLSKMFSDMKDGEFGSYINVFGQSLISFLSNLRTELDNLKVELAMLKLKI